MKNIILILLTLITLSSCKKNNDNYKTEPEPIIVNDPLSGYGNGGILPTNTLTPNNELNGTNWILTKVQIGLSVTNKSDTIRFINNTQYTVGSNTLILTYSLYKSGGNQTLTLNNFMPVNGYNCSGILGLTFVNYGQIVGVEFKDLFNSNNKFNMWFNKI